MQYDFYSMQNLSSYVDEILHTLYLIHWVHLFNTGTSSEQQDTTEDQLKCEIELQDHAFSIICELELQAAVKTQRG